MIDDYFLSLVEEDTKTIERKSAQATRRNSLLHYYSNPIKCKCCSKVIIVKKNERASQVRLKKFCDHRCAALFNNPLRPRKSYYCRDCGELLQVGFTMLKLCDNCNPNKVSWDAVTYGEMKGKRKYQVNSAIRTLARYVFRKECSIERCGVCGYDKHYHVCHKKPINKFGDDALISEINAISNLVALCPNCHWEFDNGLLEIDFGGIAQMNRAHGF